MEKRGWQNWQGLPILLTILIGCAPAIFAGGFVVDCGNDLAKLSLDSSWSEQFVSRLDNLQLRDLETDERVSISAVNMTPLVKALIAAISQKQDFIVHNNAVFKIVYEDDQIIINDEGKKADKAIFYLSKELYFSADRLKEQSVRFALSNKVSVVFYNSNSIAIGYGLIAFYPNQKRIRLISLNFNLPVYRGRGLGTAAMRALYEASPVGSTLNLHSANEETNSHLIPIIRGFEVSVEYKTARKTLLPYEFGVFKDTRLAELVNKEVESNRNLVWPRILHRSGWGVSRIGTGSANPIFTSIKK